MNREDKIAASAHTDGWKAVLYEAEVLPFLAIESDGSPFPQLINAKLEAFYLAAQRLHRRLHAAGGSG